MQFIYKTLFLVVLVQLSLQNARQTNKKYRIFKGHKAESYSAPYTVGLRINGKKYTLLCGGSLVKPEYVLTAAHCLEGAKTIKILMGELSLSKASKCTKTVEAASYIIHEDYNPNTIENDIAIIELRGPVELSNKIGLILLPRVSDTSAALVGQYGKLTGWGLSSAKSYKPSNHLKELKVRIVSNKKCPGYTLNPRLLCGYGEPVGSACRGDSGGPLVMYDTNIQIGIVTYGADEGCTIGYGHIYTNVAAYLDWINAIIK